MVDEMGTQLFVKLSSEKKKRDFKTKCVEEGYDMKEVIEQAVEEFLKKGKDSSFIKWKQ